ncbi:MAG: hypothetical protein ACR2J3_07450 [Aridibacter sp.]
MPKDSKKSKSDAKLSDSQHKGQHTLFVGTKKALIGGIIAGAIALGGHWFIGQIYSGWEARKLLEAVISSALFFGSSIVAGSSTILALMLTMLGLTKKSDGEFDSIFFKRIERIGLLSTTTLIAGVLLLLLLSFPIQQAKDVPSSWFTTIYYILISYIAILAGLVVGIVLMLNNAIKSLIDVVRPTMDEDIEDAEEREEHETKEEKERIDKSAGQKKD